MSHCYRFLGKIIISVDKSFIWKIEGTELHHLIKVLRLKTGDSVEVFDGHGSWGKGELTSITPKKEALVKTNTIHKTLKPTNPIALAIGGLKTHTMDELLPFLVELNVNEIHIFTQKQIPKHRLSERSQNRWKSIILSALKQSKSNYIPNLRVWSDFSQMVSYLTEHYDHHFTLSPTAKETLYDIVKKEGKSCIVIGGEKGLSEEEERILDDANFKPARMSNTILRSITAAIISSALLSGVRLINE